MPLYSLDGMPMARWPFWEPAVTRNLARDLDVHVIAANAGAELARQRFEAGPGECDDGIALTEAIEFILSEDDMAAGWAAWYASGDELP